MEKRILVVDDDEAIRKLLFTVLHKRGLAVDTARDGAEALDRMERCAYSLLLLDLMMPRVSGWQVLDVLSRRKPESRPVVIVLTAGTEPRDLGADLVAGSIRKPFDLDLLLDMVAGCIAILGAQQQVPPTESARKNISKDH